MSALFRSAFVLFALAVLGMGAGLAGERALGSALIVASVFGFLLLPVLTGSDDLR